MLRAGPALLALASFLVAAHASADCGSALRPEDRSSFVVQTVHGRRYVTHPAHDLRLLAPDLPAAPASILAALDVDGGSGPLSHRWAWADGDERVDVTVACVDGAGSRERLRAFAAARAGATAAGTTRIDEHEWEGVYEIERRHANGVYEATRHRVLVSGDRTLVWPVTAARRSVAAARRTIASALPPMPIAGALRTRDEIRSAIRRSVRDFQVCYEMALAADATLGGRVTASFIIDPVGDIQVAAISATTMHHAGVEACVREVATGLRFGPHASDGVVGVNYPFVFDTHSSVGSQ